MVSSGGVRSPPARLSNHEGPGSLTQRSPPPYFAATPNLLSIAFAAGFPVTSAI